MGRIRSHKSVRHVATVDDELRDKTLRLINEIQRRCMKTNDIMQYVDKLLQGCSNEECAEILKEVISECQLRIENCDEGIYTNS